MTTLSEFHTLVSDALGRSTSLDSVIATRTKLAARWLERNYTFQYMRQWKVLEVDSDAEFPHIVSLHDLEVKGVELIRRRTAEASGDGFLFDRPLKKVKPEDRETRGYGVPESYWLNGLSSLVFNAIPDEDMTFEAHFVLFTRWGSATTWTHWLLDNATNLLLSRTLMSMTSRTRDPQLWQMYKSELDLEIQSFNVAEEELQTGDFVQVWEPPEYASHESLRST